MVEDKKTVLFYALDSVGHINSLVGIADYLRSLGHRTVFLFIDALDQGLIAKGHEVYDCQSEGLNLSKPTPESEKKWDTIIRSMSELLKLDIDQSIEFGLIYGLGKMKNDIIANEAKIARKLELIKPDRIIIDHYFIQASLIKTGIPWALVWSAGPLMLYHSSSDLPPGGCGFKTNWLDNPNLEEKRKDLRLALKIGASRRKLLDDWNEWLISEHCMNPLPYDPIYFTPLSPNLNIHIGAKELDYDVQGKPSAWTHCESILRINNKIVDGDLPPQIPKFEIPECLKDKPGKLILFSLGSLVSGNVDIMKKLIGFLNKSPHRFIVSRGINWEEYELADNMWGDKFLPQLSIYPEVDLVITHGGNNTVTECFYFGVPGLIVCPLFADQLDNAQRVEDLGLGRRIHPFNCNEEELLTAIEQVLADETIRPRMKEISKRMQKPENKYKAIKLVQEFVEGKQD